MEESESVASYGLALPISSRPRKKGTMNDMTFGGRRVVLWPFLTTEPREAAITEDIEGPIKVAQKPFSWDDISCCMLLCLKRDLHFLEIGAATVPFTLRI